MTFRFVLFRWLILVIGLIAGCGGGGSSSVTPSIITTQPASAVVYESQTVTFSVTVNGSNPTYQWYRDGVAITGATTASYTTPALTLAESDARYSVAATSSQGSSTSNEAILAVVSTLANHLVISEVATCYYSNASCWFEIYNPTASAIDLGAYQVRSSGLDTTTSLPISSSTFSLPSISIPSGGHTVVAGNYDNLAQRGTQMVRIRAGVQVPHWTGSGFIELLSSGTTVDFVRWGSSVRTPAAAGQWIGAAVAALPHSPSDYGKSIVRPYPVYATTDTNTAGDWIQVNWVTPAGRNDVPAGAVDTDNDGIPDSAEVPDGTLGGLNFYAMGARTGIRDIFVEVDRMNSTDPGLIPRSESLQKVVTAFATRNIALHFDTGSQFSAGFSTATYNLGQGSNVVAYEPCVTMSQTTCTANSSSRRSIYDWKDDYMDLRRRSTFHYVLFGNSQRADGTAGVGGISEAPGNDFLITMGDWGLTNGPGSQLNQLINMQAGTVMHELGHNLGLLHGGNENLNYKPNYWSVMNYLYSLYGLDATPSGSTAYLRWKYEFHNSPTMCTLPNSPCGDPSQFIIDYSDGSGSSLNESNLLELNNIGRGSTGGGYADWDLTGTLTGSVLSINLRNDGSAKTVLNDYNDWGNLVLPFVRDFDVASGRSLVPGGVTRTPAAVHSPLVSDRQSTADEPHPPAAFFRKIRNAH